MLRWGKKRKLAKLARDAATEIEELVLLTDAVQRQAENPKATQYWEGEVLGLQGESCKAWFEVARRTLKLVEGKPFNPHYWGPPPDLDTELFGISLSFGRDEATGRLEGATGTTELSESESQDILFAMANSKVEEVFQITGLHLVEEVEVGRRCMACVFPRVEEMALKMVEEEGSLQWVTENLDRWRYYLKMGTMNLVLMANREDRRYSEALFLALKDWDARASGTFENFMRWYMDCATRAQEQGRDSNVEEWIGMWVLLNTYTGEEWQGILREQTKGARKVGAFCKELATTWMETPLSDDDLEAVWSSMIKSQ